MNAYSTKRLTISFNKVFWANVFMILALPLHSTNNLLKFVTLFNNLTIFHLIFVLLFFIQIFSLISKKQKITKKYIPSLILLLFIIIGLLVGRSNGNTNNMMYADGLYYILTFLIMFIYQSNRIKKKSFYELLVFTSKAAICSCILSLIMYFTKNLLFWGLVSFNGGRYFGGNLSLLIVVIPFLLYRYIYDKNLSFIRLVVYCFVSLYCLVLAQSRAAFIMIALSIILIFLLKSGFKQNRSEFLKKSLFVIILLVFVYFFLSSGLDVVSRLLGTDIENSFGTLSYRSYLYIGYISMIMDSLIGYGLGTKMYFYDSNLTIMLKTETFAVDSSIITVGYKFGPIAMALLVMMMVYILWVALKNASETKRAFYIFFAFTVSLFMFSTMIITAQTIHTYTIVAFFAVLFSCAQYEYY